MTLWKLTLREIGHRPGRATLTLLSIALGMAAIVAVSLGTATTRDAYRQMYEELAGRAALQITAQGGGSFDRTLAAAAEHVPGVRAAVPSLQRLTVMYFGHKRLDMLVLGIDPSKDREVRQYQVREGRGFDNDHEYGALLGINFAEGAGIHVGDEVKFMSPRGWPPLKPVKVVGLLAPGGTAGFNQGSSLFLPLGFAEHCFTLRGKINTIDLVLEPGADEKAVGAQLAKILAPGLEVHPPAARTQLSNETLASIQQGLRFSSDFAVALAVIIIVNTFLMNLSERRRQLAILRAVGATRGQIVRMLLAEGLVLGIVGTALGCVIGAGGGYLLMRGVARLYIIPPPPVAFTPFAFILAAVLGPTLAVAAAGVPAALAARIPPLEAMQPAVATEEGRTSRWLSLSGTAILAISTGLLAAGIFGWIPSFVVIPVAVVSMASIVLLIPWLVGPLGRITAWLLSPLLKLEGRLAHRQIRRRGVRTALTVGVLYLAVSLGIGQGTAIINNVADVRSWYRQTMIADFVLRVSAPDTATGQTAELPLSLGDQIRKVAGVANVDSIRFLTAEAADHQVYVVARDFTGEELALDLYRSDPESVRRGLLEGEVVLGTVLAHHAGLHVGDEITIKTRQGAKQFRIAGLAIDYMVGGYVVYMRRPVAEQLFGVQGVDAFLVQAAPGALPTVGAALTQIAGEHGMLLHSFAELTQKLDATVARLVGGLWGLLVLGFVVAALGIANTLSMNVLEQTRELALLRVVGMTRRQIRKMVLSQAGLIGLIGVGLGTGSGVATAYIITLSMMPLLGYPVAFGLHPLLFLGCCVGGMSLVLLASLLPAERAARLDLLIALQYE